MCTLTYIRVFVGCLLVWFVFTLCANSVWTRVGPAMSVKLSLSRFNSGPCHSHFRYNRATMCQPELKGNCERDITSNCPLGFCLLWHLFTLIFCFWSCLWAILALKDNARVLSHEDVDSTTSAEVISDYFFSTGAFNFHGYLSSVKHNCPFIAVVLWN